MEESYTYSNALLRRREVLGRLKISSTTLWRCVQRGEITPPLKLGRSAYWPESEIEDLVKSMMANRSQLRSH